MFSIRRCVLRGVMGAGGRLLAASAAVSTGASAAAGAPPRSVALAHELGRLATPAGLGARVTRTQVVARVGDPVVIPFEVANVSPRDRAVPVALSNASVLEGVDADASGAAVGRVLGGERIGYVVLRALRVGDERLEIGGQAVRVTVTADPAPIGLPPVRIASPSPGAAVWGTIGVGVTWWRPDAERPGESVPRLRIGNAAEPIAPVWHNEAAQGPMGLASFEIDTSQLAEGRCELRAEIAGRDGHCSWSERVEVWVIQPSDGAVIAGECEDTYDLPPLPENRRERAARIGTDARASGGKFFDSPGNSPRFRFPVQVPDGNAGWYQVMVRASGTAASATLPALGVVIDEADRPKTSSAIAATGWHRTPIGTPVRLEPGRPVIRLDYLNDFGVRGAADRNLRLDSIEVVRVAGGGASAATKRPDAMGAMSDDAMAGDGMMAGGDGMTGAQDAMAPMMGGAAADNDGGGEAWPEAYAADRGRSGVVRVSFAEVLHGRVVAGDLTVRAIAAWPGMGNPRRWHRAAAVELLLNGEVIGVQRSPSPRFVVPWEMLRPGENTLELAARVAGQRGETLATVQRVVKPGSEERANAVSAARSPRLVRLTAYEPAWDDAAAALRSGDERPPERLCLAMKSAGAVTLRLPDELAGEFEVDIEAKGKSADGAPVVSAELLWGGPAAEVCPQSKVIGAVKIGGSWTSHTVRENESGRTAAKARLEAGPKFVRLRFANDQPEKGPEKGKGRREVFVQGVALRGVDGPKPDAETVAELVYPGAGTLMRAGAADALVVVVSGPDEPMFAQAMIDGEPVGLEIDVRGRGGRVLIPLSLRGIGAGEHTVSAKIVTRSRRELSCGAVAVRMAGASEVAGAASASESLRMPEMTRYERAVILLDRFGYGPDERELADALVLGERGYLEDRLWQDPGRTGGVATAMAIAEMRYADGRSGGDVPRRAIMEALITPNPVRTRFVQFAQNHFSTWLRKTEARRKSDEHARFQQLGVARFGDLLLASATSPAMLVYLDQHRSFARRLNENYAREIMELHTLGVSGGYSQEDVTTLARLLTGWTLTRDAVAPGGARGGMDVSPDDYGLADAFRYDPALGDGKPQRFLGRQFAETGGEDRYFRTLTAIEMIAAHPSTARFVARKVVEHFLIVPAPAGLVEDLAAEFSRTGGEMRAVMLSLASHPEFWRIAAAGPTRTLHPPEFAFRLMRCAGAADPSAVHDYLNLSGHGMFDRSTPDGYQESDEEIMDSNAMLQRWRLARRMEEPLGGLAPSAVRSGDGDLDMGQAQALIDLMAMRLTGRLLGEASNAAATELLGQIGGKREERARAIGAFVASTPEAQWK